MQPTNEMTPEHGLAASAMASGLVSDQQLDYSLRVCRHRLSQQGLPGDCEIPERLLADTLVEQEVLTEYQADQLLAGRRKFFLGQYLITDWIGQGGMGQVFKAIHQVMGRECAVKVLPLARATQDARNSFAREIRMQSKLDCPFLVRAFDAGQDGNVHYLVTEYVPGMDLRRLVKSRGALPIQYAARIIMQAALGLEYAHAKGLVHRDVKPGNILVTPSGDAKVSDVGLAGFAKDLMNDPRAGKIVGTTDYLSPEQIRTPLEIKSTSDIYSLGCTLYYAVCGKVPFPGGDTESKLRRHLEAFPIHPRNFAPDITEDFVDVIVDMMEKDAQKRITNAAEVASRLEPWSEVGISVGAVTMSRTPWLAPPPPSHAAERNAGWGSEEPVWNEGSSTDGALAESTYAGRDQHATVPDLSTPARAQFPSIEPASAQDSPVAKEAAPSTVTSRGKLRGTGGGRTTLVEKYGTGLVVAITVAIVLPPALLVGAIIGYIASQ